MKNYLDYIITLPLFYGIKKENIEPLLTCLGSYTYKYQKGQIIFLEAQKIHSVGIILEGTVHMQKEDLYGNESLLSCLKKGDLFGETFACGSKTNAKVTFLSATDSQVLFLPFHKVLHSCNMSCIFHHRLIENMVRLISDKNSLLMDKIEITSKKTLRDKILCYLTIQSEKFGSQRFTIPFGRIELADYLCADRSALTRELSKMREDGLIDYEKNQFTLKI